jgi:AraC-like DNA-binding protein
MKRKYLWYLPAFLFLIPPVTYRNSETVLFPTEKNFPIEKCYEIKTYIDTVDSEGNSSCALTTVTDSLIIFDFNLHKNHGDPYAGFSINLIRTDPFYPTYGSFPVNPRPDGFIDISPYDSICVNIVTTHASFFEIQLKTDIPNITETDDFRTCHTTTCLVPIDIQSKRYSLPIEDFKLASWWDKWIKKKFGLSAKILPRKADYRKLFGINFQGGVENIEDVPLRFAITKIAFIKKSQKGMITMIYNACLCVYIIIVFLTGFILGKYKEKKNREICQLVAFINGHYLEPKLTVEQVGQGIGISPERVIEILKYRFEMTIEQYIDELKKDKAQGVLSLDDTADLRPVPPEIPDLTDLQYKQLVTSIYKNYTNSDLTLEDIAREVTISAPRITKILQLKTTMTFPQYLNNVRISAAKELLTTTKLPINEIGYNVGYFNIPHFNRVFSKSTGCTPGEYREKNMITSTPSMR